MRQYYLKVSTKVRSGADNLIMDMMLEVKSEK